jgi:hypothetical protein
MQTILAQV